MKTSRRNFVKRFSLVLSTASILPSIAIETGGVKAVNSFGFQVWTVRKKLIEDFAGTLNMMAGLGYREVEMCSPLGYSNAGFKPLHKMSAKEMKVIIKDAGLTCTSSHFTKAELRDSLQDRIDWAHQLGMEQMILSSFGLPKDASVDDYRKSADELNKIAEKTKSEGLQMGFHNHHGEFEKRGETLIYDALLDELDPELVKMQFQVAVVNIGYQAADYFRKHPGRFISAHLADWSTKKDSQVPIGKGDVDWKDFFKAAKMGGVKNFFVEMAPETFEESAIFLSDLNI